MGTGELTATWVDAVEEADAADGGSVVAADGRGVEIGRGVGRGVAGGVGVAPIETVFDTFAVPFHGTPGMTWPLSVSFVPIGARTVESK